MYHATQVVSCTGSLLWGSNTSSRNDTLTPAPPLAMVLALERCVVSAVKSVVFAQRVLLCAIVFSAPSGFLDTYVQTRVLIKSSVTLFRRLSLDRFLSENT